MAARVVVYRVAEKTRSDIVGSALASGAARVGDSVEIRSPYDYRGVEGDVAAFYGYDAKMQRIFNEYRASGKDVVYADLGYWGRVDGGRFSGYHKISVNDRHPTAYFQRRKHSEERVKIFGIEVDEWATGDAILIAGMSDKGAIAEGYKPNEWELKVIEEIGRHTDRPIVYRPKPSWRGATSLPGAGFDRSATIELSMRDCHAVVTHHSNVAVDGLIRGIPAFCWGGVAVPMAGQDLSQIESPRRPSGRRQWIADIAWCQWSIDEISAGKAWAHLKNEGLIP